MRPKRSRFDVLSGLITKAGRFGASIFEFMNLPLMVSVRYFLRESKRQFGISEMLSFPGLR